MGIGVAVALGVVVGSGVAVALGVVVGSRVAVASGAVVGAGVTVATGVGVGVGVGSTGIVAVAPSPHADQISRNNGNRPRISRCLRTIPFLFDVQQISPVEN